MKRSLTFAPPEKIPADWAEPEETWRELWEWARKELGNIQVSSHEAYWASGPRGIWLWYRDADMYGLWCFEPGEQEPLNDELLPDPKKPAWVVSPHIGAKININEYSVLHLDERTGRARSFKGEPLRGRQLPPMEF